MDALDFFLLRYAELHRRIPDEFFSRLTEAQLRGRPAPGVNTVAWLLWHTARIEDVGVNRFVADRAQVLDDGWEERLKVGRRDVGTGMCDAEVDALFRAGKPYEFLPLAGFTHMVPDPLVTERLNERIVRFFQIHLQTREQAGR